MLYDNRNAKDVHFYDSSDDEDHGKTFKDKKGVDIKYPSHYEHYHTRDSEDCRTTQRYFTDRNAFVYNVLNKRMYLRPRHDLTVKNLEIGRVVSIQHLERTIYMDYYIRPRRIERENGNRELNKRNTMRQRGDIVRRSNQRRGYKIVDEHQKASIPEEGEVLEITLKNKSESLPQIFECRVLEVLSNKNVRYYPLDIYKVRSKYDKGNFGVIKLEVRRYKNSDDDDEVWNPMGTFRGSLVIPPVDRKWKPVIYGPG